jgi:nucleotide-binding universal stress UspA family protein
MMLKTIVVPLDGSALAERALSLATALSIATAAHLVLVRVSSREPPHDEVFPDRAYLEKTAAELGGRASRWKPLLYVRRMFRERSWPQLRNATRTSSS